MGGSLALLAVWSLSALEMGLGLHLLLGVILLGLGLLRPAVIDSLPSRAWKWIGPLILIAVLADFIISMPQMIPPLVRMVALLLIYRALAKRGKREDLQLVLLCLFCLVISGALTVSLLFALQILLFAPAAMSFLFVVCLLDRGSQSSPHQIVWHNFGWRRLLRRVAHVLDLRVLALGALLYGGIMLVSSFLFVLIPRFNLEQAIPLLQIGTKARSGFSDEVKLGEVTEIAEDNSIALRVDGPSLEALDGRPYWRMLVLDQYNDGEFSLSSVLKTKYRERQSVHQIYGDNASSIVPQSEQWTFYLEGGISRYLPVPGLYRRLRFQGAQEIMRIPAVHVLGTDVVRQGVFFYQIEDLEWSRRMPASEMEREVFSSSAMVQSSGPRLYPTSQAILLTVSDADLAVLANINKQLIGGRPALDAAGYSQLVTDFLWRNYRYSLKPNAQANIAGDPVVYWLSQGSQGHCELFASAFVLLARQAGYPTRMVVGFAGGAWNSVEEYFIVRNRDAHAWVEIYDAVTNEWLRVDPTPGSGSSDPEQQVRGEVSFESGWSAWVDSLRIQWYRRIVNFDEQDQMDLAIGLKEMLGDLKSRLSGRLGEFMQGAKVWLRRPLQELSLPVVLCVAGGGSGLIVLWWFRFLWMRWLANLAQRPESLDPVRRQAGRYLAQLKLKRSQCDDTQLLEHLSEVQRQLEAVRFGPRVRESDARAVFKKTRHILRGI